MTDFEIAKALTEKQIEVLENLLALVPAVNEVVRKFDGKVLNKRFDTALRNATDDKASCTKKNYTDGWDIVLREYNNRFVSIPNETGDYATAHYIKHEYIYLADSVWNDEKWLTDDGRIKADELIADIEYHANSAAEDVKKLKGQLESVETYIAEFNRMKAERWAFECNTSYALREYFNLNF